MMDNLLVSLQFVSSRSTKVIIERFGNACTIPVDKILPKFRSLGGVVEIVTAYMYLGCGFARSRV